MTLNGQNIEAELVSCFFINVYDEDCNGYDHVLTLIYFLIYKEWLLLLLEGKDRQKD